MELLQVLVLSTGHVTSADMRRLGRKPGTQSYELAAANDAFGAWVYAPPAETLKDVRDAGYSESMVKALRFARRAGASHVRFDSDGPVLETEELDRHDW